MWGWENIVVALLCIGAAVYFVWRGMRRRHRPPALGCNGDCASCPQFPRPDDCADPATRQNKIDN